MDEALKYLLEGGGFGFCLLVTWLLIQRFVKKDILGAIEEAKEIAVNAEKAAAKFQDQMAKVYSLFSNQIADTRLEFSSELQKMSKLFTETSQYAGSAMVTAKHVENDLQETINKAHENSEKFLKIGNLLQAKVERLQSEVVKLNSEMVMVKTKK